MKVPDPDCYVDLLLDDVHDPIRQKKAKVEAGIFLGELRQDRRHMALAKAQRRGDGNLPDGLIA